MNETEQKFSYAGMFPFLSSVMFLLVVTVMLGMSVAGIIVGVLYEPTSAIFSPVALAAAFVATYLGGLRVPTRIFTSTVSLRLEFCRLFTVPVIPCNIKAVTVDCTGQLLVLDVTGLPGVLRYQRRILIPLGWLEKPDACIAAIRQVAAKAAHVDIRKQVPRQSAP